MIVVRLYGAALLLGRCCYSEAKATFVFLCLRRDSSHAHAKRRLESEVP